MQHLQACQKNDFKCIHGQCIPKEWLCDGLRDCQLGEDEEQNCGKKLFIVTYYSTSMSKGHCHLLKLKIIWNNGGWW